jgi:hypothetical protein
VDADEFVMSSVAAINQLMAIITSMMDEEPDYDLEIVGLRSGTNDRSCCQHEICGAQVLVGDVLRLVKCIVTINLHCCLCAPSVY